MMPRQAPMSPPQPGGAGDPLGDAKGMRSVFNPTDLSMSVQDGELSPDSTVGDLLNKLGMTVEDRITDLLPVLKQQMDSASPLNKMQNLAQKQPAPQKGGMPSQGGAPVQKPFQQGAKPMAGGFSEMFPQGG